MSSTQRVAGEVAPGDASLVSERSGADAVLPNENTVLASGKYKGQTFKQVYESYPAYVVWVARRTNRKGQLAEFHEYCLRRQALATAGPSAEVATSSTAAASAGAAVPAESVDVRHAGGRVPPSATVSSGADEAVPSSAAVTAHGAGDTDATAGVAAHDASGAPPISGRGAAGGTVTAGATERRGGDVGSAAGLHERGASLGATAGTSGTDVEPADEEAQDVDEDVRDAAGEGTAIRDEDTPVTRHVASVVISGDLAVDSSGADAVVSDAAAVEESGSPERAAAAGTKRSREDAQIDDDAQEGVDDHLSAREQARRLGTGDPDLDDANYY